LDVERQDKKNPIPSFPNSEIGICHILPVYLLRKKNKEKKENGRAIEKYQVRYTIPLHSVVRIKLIRDANARLYGTTIRSCGIRIGQNDEIRITGSTRIAKIIKLETIIV
jgi:NAD+ kinase